MSGINFMSFVQVTNPASTQKSSTNPIALIPLAPFDKSALLSKVRPTTFEEGILNIITVTEGQKPGEVQGPQQVKEIAKNMESVFHGEKLQVAS